MTLAAGLPFRISIGGLSKIAKEAGLTEEWLENAVELGLRRNKIPLPGDHQSPECRAALDAIPPGETRTLHECAMSLKAFRELPTSPILHMSILVLEVSVNGRNAGYTYYVEMTISKLVALDSETQPNDKARVAGQLGTVYIELWKYGEIGTISNADGFKSELRRFISEQTDAIGMEYLRYSQE